MSKFEYRFKNIEEVKEKMKKNAEKEYAVVLMNINKKKEEIEGIKKEIESSYQDVRRMTPQEMVFMEKYRDTLKTKIKKKENELKKLEKELKAKQEELTKRHKEHKVFVKLKEKQLNDYQEEQKKLEQKATDEIANQKFNNK